MATVVRHNHVGAKTREMQRRVTVVVTDGADDLNYNVSGYG